MSVFWGQHVFDKKHMDWAAPLTTKWRFYGVTIGWFFIGYIRRSNGEWPRPTATMGSQPPPDDNQLHTYGSPVCSKCVEDEQMIGSPLRCRVCGAKIKMVD